MQVPFDRVMRDPILSEGIFVMKTPFGLPTAPAIRGQPQADLFDLSQIKTVEQIAEYEA